MLRTATHGNTRLTDTPSGLPHTPPTRHTRHLNPLVEVHCHKVRTHTHELLRMVQAFIYPGYSLGA